MRRTNRPAPRRSGRGAGVTPPLAVTSDTGPGGAPASPCGQCRQFLREFDPGATLVVGSNRTRPANGSRWTLTELLPDSFGPDDLGETRAVGSGDGAGAATEIPEGRP